MHNINTISPGCKTKRPPLFINVTATVPKGHCLKVVVLTYFMLIINLLKNVPLETFYPKISVDVLLFKF